MSTKSRAVAVLCSVVAVLCAMPALAQDRQEPEPLVDLLNKVASCTALILPPASTPEEVASNERAAQAFRELRSAIYAAEPAKTCGAVSTDTPSTSSFSTVPTATCTDCDGCLSAASCSDGSGNGCAVGSNCNANPPRFCRSVKKCSSISNGHCCGCSS